MRRVGLLVLLLCLPSLAARTDSVRLDGPLVQGGMVIGRTAPGSQVQLDGAAVRVSPAGEFVIGFGRDAAPEAVLVVRAPDGREERRTLAVEERRYDIQRIDGLPERKVTPPEEVWERIKAEQAQITAARQLDTEVPHFLAGFAWPAVGRISGIYGSQRVLNGKPRRPHYGVDVAAAEGAPVGAAAPGIVALVHEDMYYTGKTVMLDHGHGVTSVYIHMSRLLVREGDTVAKGQPIGAVGQTGRASGPHLHWGVYWGERPLDPALLVPPMAEAQAQRSGESAPR